MPVTLFFESELPVDPDVAWAWITSLDGISKETRPILRMTAPRGMRDLSSTGFVPGVPMFRSWILLFGIVPVDWSDLTLVAMMPGAGFVEQSTMGSMRFWRHERRIQSTAGGCRIADTLTFEPKLGGRLVAWCVGRLFAHRHRMLARHLGRAG